MNSTFTVYMLKLIFLILVLYFIFKFIFDVVIPVSKASSQIRNKMKEMQQQQSADFQNRREATSETSKPNTPADKKDYIDFEEVK